MHDDGAVEHAAGAHAFCAGKQCHGFCELVVMFGVHSVLDDIAREIKLVGWSDWVDFCLVGRRMRDRGHVSGFDLDDKGFASAAPTEEVDAGGCTGARVVYRYLCLFLYDCNAVCLNTFNDGCTVWVQWGV